jgi:SAM-dependent methyltransferase
MSLQEQFGRIDIYLFDQILRGNILPGMRVVDAGCGHGRNLVYLLREVGAIDAMPFADGLADVVVCNSVLHFARDDAHFDAMVRELWRVLRPGGMLFCRLGSTIGAGAEMGSERVQGAGSPRMFRLPDGEVWYLVDEAMLMELTRSLGGRLIDPLKTTVVQGTRCMTTWVVRKALLSKQ